MADKELDIVQENLLFSIFNTFDFSWEVSQTWDAFSFTEVSKELLLLPRDPCPWPAQKSPLNVWLSHRNSLLNGISVMDSC